MQYMRLLFIISITVAACYLAILGALWVWQSRLVFYPVRQLRSNPSQYKLDFEDITVPSGQETIHGWFLEGRPGQPVVLYCHGNAGNISDRLPQIRAIHDAGLGVFAFDYAGYGWSTGSPSESQMYVDASSAFSWLVKRGIPSNRVIVYGESLGGAVGAQLSAAVHPLLLVLEATFTSLEDVARIHYPWVPVGWLLRYRFDTRDHLSRVKCRTVVLHSRQDEIVPYDQAVLLCAMKGNLCKFIEVTGSHNTMPPVPWERVLTENGIEH